METTDPEWGDLAASVLPASYGAIVEASLHESLDPYAVGRALKRAGLFAAPLELVAGTDEPAAEEGGPAITFEDGDEGIEARALPGRAQ